MHYNYNITPRAVEQIIEFYAHVKLKYQHVYSYEDMKRNVRHAIFDSNMIEKTLLRRKPTLSRWKKQGFHMAHSGHWYYAYTINGDTIIIEDACHEQNMHNNDK